MVWWDAGSGNAGGGPAFSDSGKADEWFYLEFTLHEGIWLVYIAMLAENVVLGRKGASTCACLHHWWYLHEILLNLGYYGQLATQPTR